MVGNKEETREKEGRKRRGGSREDGGGDWRREISRCGYGEMSGDWAETRVIEDPGGRAWGHAVRPHHTRNFGPWEIPGDALAMPRGSARACPPVGRGGVRSAPALTIRHDR